MNEDDPDIVISELSCMATVDNITVEVSIFRLEDEDQWTLEVINENGTSMVWEDPFETDEDAFAAFQHAIEQEGIETFLDDDDPSHTVH